MMTPSTPSICLRKSATTSGGESTCSGRNVGNVASPQISRVLYVESFKAFVEIRLSTAWFADSDRKLPQRRPISGIKAGYRSCPGENTVRVRTPYVAGS